MPDLKSIFLINTITQLSGFLVFAVLMNRFSLTHVVTIFIMLMLALVVIKATHFLRILKRMKWFFLVMLLIFAFNTPGQHIQGWNYLLSPTYEGLASGLLQVFRMLVLLAALSFIMAINTKPQLIAGFYFMLLPLQRFGLEVERFAARLWLTLEYVESAQQLNKVVDQKLYKPQNFFEQLKQFGHTSIIQQTNSSITFEMPIFKMLDIVVLASLMLISVYVILKAFA